MHKHNRQTVQEWKLLRILLKNEHEGWTGGREMLQLHRVSSRSSCSSRAIPLHKPRPPDGRRSLHQGIATCERGSSAGIEEEERTRRRKKEERRRLLPPKPQLQLPQAVMRPRICPLVVLPRSGTDLLDLRAHTESLFRSQDAQTCRVVCTCLLMIDGGWRVGQPRARGM